MPRSSSTTGPTWATRWSCTTDTRCAVLISCRAAPTTTEHRGRAGTEGFRPALLCLCLWSRWCSGRRRARPPARLGVLTSFGAAPRSPPVPSGPSGALHTGGACVSGVPVGCGPPASRPRRELRSARRLEARPGPAAAHSRRSQASASSGALHTSGACRSGVPGQALPPTLTNFARNSPATVSNLECASLELQRFQRLLKLLSIELRASFPGPAVYRELRQPVRG